VLNAQSPENNISDGAVDPSIYDFDKDLHKYYQDMQLFILDKMAEPMPDELKHQIEHAREHSNRTLSKHEIVTMVENFWKFDFVSNHDQPISKSVNLKSNQISSCDNGGFENDFVGYERYRGMFVRSSTDCNPLDAFGNGAQPISWEQLIDIPNTYPQDYVNDINIVYAGIDPYLPTSSNLNQVQFGNSALRINNIVANNSSQCGFGFQGINKVEKKFIVESETSEFVVWYAVVLNDPLGGHINQFGNRKPFFNIQFLKGENVVEELCWDSGEDFFTDIAISSVNCNDNNNPSPNVRYQNWRCSIFNLKNYLNDELTLRITTADCGVGEHFGYAYIDGICEACAEVFLTSLDRCALSTYELCGSYNTVEGANSNLNLLSMSYVLVDEFNNMDTLPIPNSNIDTMAKTFCVEVDPTFIQPDICYDIYTIGYFSTTVGGLPIVIRSSTFIPGQFNDFCDYKGMDYSSTVTCDNNNTSLDISDDQFSLVLDLSIPDNANWVIYQSPSIDIASGSGDQIVTIGPFDYQDCDVLTFYDPICDTSIVLQYDVVCTGCTNLFRVCANDIICDDRGTSNTSDDQWSIILYVDSNTNGTYSVDPPFTLGTYNTPMTINMGEINQYGSTHTIRIEDSNQGCFLDYTIEVPAGCQAECTYGYTQTISDCKLDKNGFSYYNVTFESTGGFNNCIPDFYIVNSNGSTSLLNISVSGSFIELGPFYISQGAIRIRIVGCNNCEEEIVIFPPFCSTKKRITVNQENHEYINRNNAYVVSNSYNSFIVSWEDDYMFRDIKLFNMNGQLILNRYRVRNHQKIDDILLPTGIYIIQVIDELGNVSVLKYFTH